MVCPSFEQIREDSPYVNSKLLKNFSLSCFKKKQSETTPQRIQFDEGKFALYFSLSSSSVISYVLEFEGRD